MGDLDLNLDFIFQAERNPAGSRFLTLCRVSLCLWVSNKYPTLLILFSIRGYCKYLRGIRCVNTHSNRSSIM